ncbi:MAG: endonuclease domain-containing protein [Truepera sp.]|nr:endonuclease domain-containing protein [Truepera sp.]
MSLTPIARQLRHAMTSEEYLLWQRLRRNQLGVKFRRQEPIGRYIVDFVCFEHRVIIEADGSHHLNNPADKARDAFFASQGFVVLRFWNSDIRDNLEGVLTAIQNTISQRSR